MDFFMSSSFVQVPLVCGLKASAVDVYVLILHNLFFV